MRIRLFVSVTRVAVLRDSIYTIDLGGTVLWYDVYVTGSPPQSRSRYKRKIGVRVCV